VEGVSAAYVRIFTVSVPEVMGGLDDSVHIYETSWGDFWVRSGLENLLIIINISDGTIEVILVYSICNHWIN
jgi:hypothetical protein